RGLGRLVDRGVLPAPASVRPDGFVGAGGIGTVGGVARTVDEWSRKRPVPILAEQSHAWLAAFVADLTARALTVARQGGITGPITRLEIALTRTCQQALQRHEEPWLTSPGIAARAPRLPTYFPRALRPKSLRRG